MCNEKDIAYNFTQKWSCLFCKACFKEKNTVHSLNGLTTLVKQESKLPSVLTLTVEVAYVSPIHHSMSPHKNWWQTEKKKIGGKYSKICSQKTWLCTGWITLLSLCSPRELSHCQRQSDCTEWTATGKFMKQLLNHKPISLVFPTTEF